jgi:hypothetical protein
MKIKEYFGAAGYSNFPTHKDEERKQRYINRYKKMKFGRNQVLIRQDFGVDG